MTTIEKITDFLGSIYAKMLFVSFVCLFLGNFLLTEYTRGNNAVCSGARFVIERNVEIEYDLIHRGDIDGAQKLHKSLVRLAERADDCDFDLLKYLKRKHA